MEQNVPIVHSQEHITAATLIQMNPVHTLTPHLNKMYFCIIFPSTYKSAKWWLSFKFFG